MAKTSVEQRAINWIIGDHTGTSSKTMWAVLMGADLETPDRFRFSPPHDPSDFRRCHLLLEAVPEWRERLPEVAAAFPIWGPLVREWDKLTALYLRDREKDGSPELYRLMKKLLDEGRIADGQVKDGPGCGKRKDGGGTVRLGKGVTIEF